MKTKMWFLGASEFGVSNRGGTLEMDSPYHDLANAIIVQATKDYKVAKEKRNTKEIDSLTDFFHGGWFSTLTKVNPDYILGRL